MYSNVTAYVSNSFTFSSYLIASNFTSVLIVFCRYFTWIALGDVDLCFSRTWVTKANAVEGGTTSATRLCHKSNQFTHVTDGVTMTSLSASLQHTISAATDRL